MIEKQFGTEYFYNPRTGQCFPSHKAIAIKPGCRVRTVQRALKWAHGPVRDGWRVIRHQATAMPSPRF